jgi:hypothetical protein
MRRIRSNRRGSIRWAASMPNLSFPSDTSISRCFMSKNMNSDDEDVVTCNVICL